MILTTLKEEARKEFDKALISDKSCGGFCEIKNNTPMVEPELIKQFIDSIIDRTYHATKEEVRVMVEGMKPSNLELYTYPELHQRDTAYDKVIASLEDTTTDPNH